MQDARFLSLSHWQTCKQLWITSESNQIESMWGDTSSWNNKIQVFRHIMWLNELCWHLIHPVLVDENSPDQNTWKNDRLGDLTAHQWGWSGTMFSLLHSHVLPSNFCWIICQRAIIEALIGITRRVRGLACLWRCCTRCHSDVSFPWCGNRSLAV